jgi:hypothetical protein
MTSKFALVIANTEYQDTSFAKLTAASRDVGIIHMMIVLLQEFMEGGK